MKKNWIKYIIALLTISLAGIILIQLLWINNAIVLRQSMFDARVTDALKETAEVLEKKEAVAQIGQKISSKGPSLIYHLDDSLVEMNTVDIIEGKKDSALRSMVVTGHSMITDTGSVKLMHTGKGDKESVLTYSYSGSDTAFTWMVKSSGESEDDSTIVIMRNRLQRLNKKVVKVDNLIDQMVFEIEVFNLPISERLDHDQLEAALRKRLQANGIRQDFLFAVTEGENDSLTALRSPGFDEGNLGRSYHTKLFPGDVFERNEFLHLYIPGKQMGILKSIGWLLGGSLLLTIVIIVLFRLTVMYILKQKKISEMRSDFLNNMTHEFKTPIATINLAADAIENKLVINEPQKIKYYTGMIREENRRMNSHIESVLQISMLEKNGNGLTLEKCDAHEIIDQAVKQFSLQVSRRNGEIHLELEAMDPDIMADKTHLTNVLLNILDNALKYTIGNPVIKIHTSKAEGVLSIKIEDNGQGMSKDVQKKIFDAFYRKHTGNVHNVKGFGLGLSYSRTVLSLMGGTIEVESSPGKGSTFTIRFSAP